MGSLGEAKGKIVLETDLTGLKKGEKGVEDFGKKAQQSTKSTRDMEPALNDAANTAAVAGAALAGAFAYAVKSASDFEFRLSAIQSVSGATSDEMAGISDKALQIGRDTAYGAGEAAGAIEELAKAGLSLDDIMAGAADATVSLAAAGEVALPEAATISANAMNQFGLEAADLVNVADKISGAANNSAITVSDFGQSLTNVGAVANLAGISFDDTASAIALMGNAGIKGSDAGTSLKSMFLRLNPQSAKAKDTMKELGIITEDGSNQFYDAAGNMKSLSDVSGILQNSLAGMTKEQKQAALTTMFGSFAIRGAAVLAEGGSEAFDKMNASIAGVSAAEVAAKRLDNLQGSVTIMKGSMETAAITIGQYALPAVKDLVDQVTVLINKFAGLDENVQKNILAFTGGGAAALLLTAGIIKAYLAAAKMRRNLLLASGAQTIFGKTGAIAAAVTKTMTTAQALYNRVLSANPILRIVTIILAVVAALITLAGGWEEVKKAFEPTLAALQDAMKTLMPLVQDLLDVFMGMVTDIVAQLLPVLLDLAQQILPMVMDVINALVPIIVMLVSVLASVLGPVLQIVAKLIEALGPVIGVILEALAPLIDLLLRALVPVLDAVVWVLDQLAAGLQWVISWLSGFFAKTDEGTSQAGNAWQSMMGFIQPVIDWFSETVGPAIEAVVNFLVTSFQFLASAAKTVWDAIWSVIETFLDWWEANVAPLIQAVVDLVVAIFNLWWAAVKAIWQGVTDAIQAFMDWFDANVAPLIQAVVDLIVAIFNLWWAGVKAVWNALWGLIQSFLDWFSRNVVPPIEKAIGIVIGIFTKVMNVVKSVFSTIWNTVKSVVGWVVDKISGAWGTLYGTVRGIFDKVYNAIKDPMQKAIDFISGIKDTILGVFRNAGTWLKDAGAKIINGLKEGIENTIGKVKDTLTGITDKLTSWKGPPKKDKVILKPAGQMIIQGLMSGIQAEVGNLHGLLGGLNVSIPAAMDASMFGSGVGSGSVSDNRQYSVKYNAAPGAQQISGEEELMRAMRRARVAVPGWGG